MPAAVAVAVAVAAAPTVVVVVAVDCLTVGLPRWKDQRPTKRNKRGEK